MERSVSVDFEPVPLRPGRSRRFDPVAAGALVVAIALVFAIAKPWAGEGPDRAMAVPSPGPPTAAGTARPSADAASAAADPRTAVRYLSALGVHDSWGIRAVVAAPNQGDLAERWVAVAPGWSVEGPRRPISLDPHGADVLALGVTTPADATPLAIRVWRAGPGRELTWMDARHVASDLPAAELLLLPPSVDGQSADRWPAGDFRIDLLLGERIVHLDIRLDGPAVAARPSLQPARPQAAAREAMPPAWLGNVPTGAYAVVDGVVVPLTGGSGPTLDAARAWLDAVAGDQVDHGRHVASIGRAGAAAIGVMLPGGAHDASGVLRRLTPGPGSDLRNGTVGSRVDASNNPTAFLLFRTREGEAWPAGTYALEATWDGPGGRRAATWHVELTPGPPDAGTNLIAAARAFGPFAGHDGLLVGNIDQLRDPVRAAGLLPRPIEADPDNMGPSYQSIGCDDAYIDERPPVLGLAHPIDRAPSSVEVAVLGPFRRSVAVRLRTVLDVVPGLTLLAPARGATFPDGVYRITIRDDSGMRELQVCLGTSPFNG